MKNTEQTIVSEKVYCNGMAIKNLTANDDTESAETKMLILQEILNLRKILFWKRIRCERKNKWIEAFWAFQRYNRRQKSV